MKSEQPEAHGAQLSHYFPTPQEVRYRAACTCGWESEETFDHKVKAWTRARAEERKLRTGGTHGR